MFPSPTIGASASPVDGDPNPRKYGGEIGQDDILVRKFLNTLTYAARHSIGYIDFPYVGQVFLTERETPIKKTGELRREIAPGLAGRNRQDTSPQRLLATNRDHWLIESVHHIIDWNHDEDRSRIRTGFGPENITRLRRLPIGIPGSFRQPGQAIAGMMRKPSLRIRGVFACLRMTENSGAPAG